MLQIRTIAILCAALVSASCTADVGRTTIEKWPDGRRAAVSITYDGGTINQFDVALPVMNQLGLPATFFIVTGDIAGSQYGRTFIGRPVEEVAAEVASGIPTTEENFFERASAARILPIEGAIDFHTRAGDLYETGRFDEAYATIEEAYRKAESTRSGGPVAETIAANPDVDATWEDLRRYAEVGHEFASHSVSHAQLATLDDANLSYELEKSREEIMNFLGPAHTFSVECPYGTENERVMEKTLALYPASRNRMPEAYLDEINRWSDRDPASSTNEYVQWQRGPKSATPLEEMKSWVDRIASSDNVWLVLVFHGVEGVGWEPKSGEDLEAYFGYIAARDDVWPATFRNVTRYIRERMAAELTSEWTNGEIRLQLSHPLDEEIYDYPLSLRTRVPDGWEYAEVGQGLRRSVVDVVRSDTGAHVIFEANPNGGVITVRSSAGD